LLRISLSFSKVVMKKILRLFSFFLLIFTLIKPLQAAFVEFPNKENSVRQKQTLTSYFNNISNFFSFVLALVFIFSLCGLILSGITFMMAGGNENNLDKARALLISSSVGLIISMVGYISLNLLKHFF